jgi:hypothetical protein
MIDVTDLEDDSFMNRNGAKPVDNRQKYTCPSCGGSGQYRGYRVNQAATECFSCAGRGFTLLDPRTLKERNTKRKATIAKKRTDGIADFRDAHPDLYMAMLANQWSGFLAGLVQQLNERGFLSENQIAAAQRTVDQIAAKEAAKREAKAKDTKAVDISAIEALFATANSNGLKRPKFRADGIEISQAAATGRNPGALYVRAGDEYQGKIVDGKFMPVRETRPDTFAKVEAVAADPLGQARLYGKLTGVCGCCGRELTDPVSIERGIGPICESKWF